MSSVATFTFWPLQFSHTLKIYIIQNLFNIKIWGGWRRTLKGKMNKVKRMTVQIQLCVVFSVSVI